MIKLLLLAAVLSAPSQAARKRAKRPPAAAAPAAAAPSEALPAPLQPRAVQLHERRPGVGTVSYATARRAYLDAGSRDGLAQGTEVHLSRAGRAVGPCRVELIAETQAICVGRGVRVGDTFALEARPTTPPPKKLPPRPSPGELARRHAMVSALTFRKVDFQSTQAVAPVVEYHGNEIQLGHATYSAYGAGPTQLERLDVNLRGVPLGGSGVAAYIDMTAERWTLRDTARFRPNDQNQLYVWEADLKLRDPGRALSFAVGRVRPWSAPGSTIFDGAQVGWHPGRSAEIGVFGGGLPDPETLYPTLNRRMGGLYLSLEQAGRSSGIIVREDARVAAVQSPELGRRVEAEAEGQVYLGRRIQGTADVRFGFGDSAAPGNLDAARADLSVQPIDRLTLLGGYRYVGLNAYSLSATGVSVGLAPSRHADVAAAFDATRWLTVSATGGRDQDLSVGVDRTWIGPEVTLPKLLWGGSVSGGWHYETGWVGGQDAFVQVVAEPLPWLRVLSRASYFRDTYPGTISSDAVGLFLNALTDLGRWLRLRVALYGRVSLRANDTVGRRPDGITGEVDLVGSY